MNEDRKNIYGSVLRELRESKQMSLAEVIMALDKIGLRKTNSWLSMLENGKSGPSLEIWLALLQIYDCDPIQFFCLINNKTVEPFISPVSKAPGDFWTLSGFWDGVSYQLPTQKHNFADFKIGFGFLRIGVGKSHGNVVGTQETIYYSMEGEIEIEFLNDESNKIVKLGKGQMINFRGFEHVIVNKSDKPCSILFVKFPGIMNKL